MPSRESVSTLRTVSDVESPEQPRLDFVVEGAPGTIALRSFLSALDDARAVIEGVDVAIMHLATPMIEWYVEDLHMSSLAATLVGKPRRSPAALEYTPQLGHQIATTFVEGLRTVEMRPIVPPSFPEQSMRRLKQLGNVMGRNGAKGFRAVKLESGGELVSARVEARLTRQAAINAKEALSPRYTADGSVVGRLDVISVHKGQQFTIYDEIDRRPVKGSFSEALLGNVKEALSRRVIATGIIRRNGAGQMISILVETLEILPADHQLPTVGDLVGSDPDFTNGLPADVWVRKVRDA